MATTLDTILQQEQLHYQVLKQNLDNLYLNLNSSNNQQTNTLTALINNQTNNLGGQLYTQSSRVIQSLQGQAVTLEQEILNTMRGLFNSENQKLDSVQIALQQKLDASLAQIKGEIDKEQGIITANLLNGIDKLYNITVQVSKEVTTVVQNAEYNLKSAVDTLTHYDETQFKSLQSSVSTALNSSSQDINQNIKDIAQQISSNNGLFGSSEPQFLTDLMSNFYNALNPPKGQEPDNAFVSIIRLFSGNAAADSFKVLGQVDFGKAINNQIAQVQTIIDKTTRGDYKTLQEFTTDFRKLGVNSDLVYGVLQFLFIVPALLNIGKELTGAFNTRIQQLTNAEYELKQLNDSDVIIAFIRNLISYEDAVNQLEHLGHKREDSELMLKSSFPKYSVQDLFKLAHLGKISPDVLKERLRELGWNEVDAILQGYLNEIKPGINDLIQFAVKEVYSPETYTLFGQYQEFPEEFSSRAKLLGMSEEHARQYWAAHWQLPSAGMGYDMFHRRIINQEQLKALLKALDVMPFWRDKLVQLSYNVVARVDTRRLYAYGIWDKNKVYQNYLDEGYSPQDAQALTQFTIAYDDEQDNKHKTALQKKAKDTYIKAFNNRLITKDTAKNKIVALGYKDKDVQLELDLEEYDNYIDSHKTKSENHVAKIISLSLDAYRKKALSRGDLLAVLLNNGYTLSDANVEADLVDKEADIAFKQTVIKQVQALYFDSLYDDNMVLTKLMQLGFNNNEALHQISELQILKSLDDKKPSQPQFKTAYEDALISRDEYAQILAEMGYNEKYIPLIIALSDGKKAN